MTDPRAALAKAESCLRGGDPRTCMELCEQLLAVHPELDPARFLLGVAAVHREDFVRAAAELTPVCQRSPANPHAAFFLGVSLRRLERYADAIPPLQTASSDPTHRSGALYELAVCANRTGDGEAATYHYRELLEHQPDHADAAANLAALLERNNQQEEATRWARRALESAPDHPVASLALATLERRGGNPGAAAQRLDVLLASQNLTILNRAMAENELGQANDKLKRYRDAWRAFGRSNDLLRKHHPEGRVEPATPYAMDTLNCIVEWLNETPASAWNPSPADDGPAPVFVLGFPRSGTTLLDVLLGSHPAITVLEEQELLLGVRDAWTEQSGIEQIHLMDAASIEAARAEYRRAQLEASNGAEGVVVDKLPLNSVYLPLIHRLFPNARIIHAMRDPRDACISCWFGMFDLVGAMPYFLDIGDTVNYYDAVSRVLRSSLASLPIQSQQVRYEELVTDLEGTLRPVLEFLGLDWDESILDYRKATTGQRIKTPSYQQVSRPLYTSSIGRWKNYETDIGDAFEPLDRWVREWGYDQG